MECVDRAEQEQDVTVGMVVVVLGEVLLLFDAENDAADVPPRGANVAS